MKDIANTLRRLRGDNKYSGKLNVYAVRSIEEGISSYSVNNLIEYCDCLNISIAIIDSTTDESYDVDSIIDIHNVIGMLMKRYNIDTQTIYRNQGVHYTIPTTPTKCQDSDTKYQYSLSASTLIKVLNELKCVLFFKRLN